jgi:hypothetical protein
MAQNDGRRHNSHDHPRQSRARKGAGAKIQSRTRKNNRRAGGAGLRPAAST